MCRKQVRVYVLTAHKPNQEAVGYNCAAPQLHTTNGPSNLSTDPDTPYRLGSCHQGNVGGIWVDTLAASTAGRLP
ncbi:hypothetical protein MOLA814_00429 [Betaproteobacteria bacterium MOLA814]|nr:hypothetical protein MOLA814_00429 [Betaproteobacteria bacterium MOLA814]